jgi:quercetin dioxygenase-like cupin family protein
MTVTRIEEKLPMALRVVQTSAMPEFRSDATLSRDLGLGDATSGVFTARRARTGTDKAIDAVASDANGWFTFLYVLAGEMDISFDGERRTLRAHDAVSQLPFSSQTVTRVSADLEFLEVQAVDDPRTRAILPTRPRPTIAIDSPQAHAVGTGPRNFFDYRNLGVAEATDRLIEVQVVRAQRAKEGGTGWHSHNMAQLSYGLSGWAMLDVEGVADKVRQATGDALSIPANWRHNASSFSDDYWALQLQIPADYDTVVRDAPEPADAGA